MIECVSGIVAKGKGDQAINSDPIVTFIARVCDIWACIPGTELTEKGSQWKEACYGEIGHKGGCPQQFWLKIGTDGSWEIRAHFGINGNREQAIEFLQALVQAGVSSIMIWGPPNRKQHFSESKANPQTILKEMGAAVAVPA